VEVPSSILPPSIAAKLSSVWEPAIIVHKGKIISCNRAWQDQCGFELHEALGKSPKILQGELTDTCKAVRFRMELEQRGKSATTLCNYTKCGRLFVHRIRGQQLDDPETNQKYYLTQGTEVDSDAVRGAVLRASISMVAAREARAWTLVTLVGALGVLGVVVVEPQVDEQAGQFWPPSVDLQIYGAAVHVLTAMAAVSLFEVLRRAASFLCTSSDDQAVPAAFVLTLVGMVLVCIPSVGLALIAVPLSTALLTLGLSGAVDEVLALGLRGHVKKAKRSELQEPSAAMATRSDGEARLDRAAAIAALMALTGLALVALQQQQLRIDTAVAAAVSHPHKAKCVTTAFGAFCLDTLKGTPPFDLVDLLG